jgi:hypothetical protein
VRLIEREQYVTELNKVEHARFWLVLALPALPVFTLGRFRFLVLSRYSVDAKNFAPWDSPNDVAAAAVGERRQGRLRSVEIVRLARPLVEEGRERLSLRDRGSTANNSHCMTIR